MRDDRGIGRYLRAVLRALVRREDAALTLVVRDPGSLRHRDAFAAALGVADVRVRWRVPPDAAVVWHPWNGTFLRAAVPAVATMHDVVPFVEPAGELRTRKREQAPFERSFRTARRFIAVSAFTAGELTRVAGIDPARIDVIHHGVDPEFVPGVTADVPMPLRGRPFILHVGAHDPRKNVGTLLEAFARAWPHGEVMLALTRPPAAPQPHVVVLDDLDTQALAATYRAASAVAVPSTYEGFGLPLIEAMACGTPVVASRAAALPEAGGDAPYWVESPTDVNEWTNALRAAIEDQPVRETLRARGLARATAFDWERCAAATFEVLQRAAAR